MSDYNTKKIDDNPVQVPRILADGTHDVLDLCQKIKFMSAELHHYFADLYKEDRDSLLLWKRIAMEEENNAKEFALVAKLKRQNVIHSLRIEPVEAEVMYIYLQTLLEKLKELPPSPKDALEIAIKVEEKLTPFHMNSIIKFSDPSFRKLFYAAILSDRQRIETFRKSLKQMVKV